MKGISNGKPVGIYARFRSFALALVCISLSGIAVAESPSLQFIFHDPPGYRGTGQAACGDWQAANNALSCPGDANVKITSVSFDGGSGCAFTYTQCNGTGGGQYGADGLISRRLWCAAANAPPKADGTCPTAYVCPTAGQAAGAYQTRITSATPPPSADYFVCELALSGSFCEIRVSPDFATATSNNEWTQVGQGSHLGTSCTPSATGTGSQSDPFPKAPATPKVAGTAAPVPCARGEYSGQVNGVDTCVKPAPTGTTVTNTPGQTTSTDAAGVKTTNNTQENVTCSAATCTTVTSTTTTVTNAAGATTSTQTIAASTQQDRGAYCGSHPGVAACSGTSNGNGTGENTDDCKGDTTSIRCGKGDVPSEATPTKGFMVTYAEENLLGTGGGSCPADKVVTINGKTMTVWDWQHTCTLLTTYVKPLMITMATVIAFFLLSPGKST